MRMLVINNKCNVRCSKEVKYLLSPVNSEGSNGSNKSLIGKSLIGLVRYMYPVRHCQTLSVYLTALVIHIQDYCLYIYITPTILVYQSIGCYAITMAR